MQTIIIGDIHGCSAALRRLLDKLQPDRGQDRLILLGDLFDRGPDSWGVLQIVRSLASAFGDRFVLLRGNHEDYLLSEKLTFGQKLVWERVGRRATVKSFRSHGEEMEAAIPFLQEHCRTYYSGEDIQCVHAGLMVEPIEVNDAQTMIHDHGVALRNHYAGPITVTGHIALDKPTWFAGDGETVRTLPFGEDLTLPQKGTLCIDTGCGKGGRLTGMKLSGNIYRLESTAEA